MSLQKKLASAQRIVSTQGTNGLIHVIKGKALSRTRHMFPTWWKEWNELDFWFKWKAAQKFGNSHYLEFFTSLIELDPAFYAGKRILDIGCGPMGSLEWADMAAERIGLDTLVDQYRQLGIDKHRMKYVAAPSEAIPFADGYFDVVSSFNSLDHVKDVNASCAEIARVLKPGGIFLLLTDVGHEPTDCEPQSIAWDIVETLKPHFVARLDRHFERRDGSYNSVKLGIPFDHANPAQRPGTLFAKLEKVVRA